MKKLSRILLSFLVVVLAATSLSACSSDSTAETTAVPTTEAEEVSEPENAMYVFSFLDLYYENIRLIEEVYHKEISTDVFYVDPFYEEILGLMNTDSSAYALLPCGTGYIRKDTLALESLDVDFSDLTDSEEQRNLTAVEALAVFHSLEGEPLSFGYSFSNSDDILTTMLRRDWENNFEKSMQAFRDHITAATYDQSIIDAITDGETVLLYSGNYNYSFYLKNLGESSSDGEDHFVISLKIEAN